jgi:hypothetical protein
MDEPLPSAGGDESRHMLQFFLGRYDAPAFVRRARDTEGAWRVLLETARRQRHALLDMVKLRLGTLKFLTGAWANLAGLVESNDDLDLLARLHDELQPQPRLPPAATASHRAWKRALAELCQSLERFNRLWLEHLRGIDLDPINKMREDYNRFYLVEKECAVGSARLARQGFQNLGPITLDDLLAALPPLPLPRVK